MLMVNDFLLGGGGGRSRLRFLPGGSRRVQVDARRGERPGPRGTPRTRAAAGPSADRLSNNFILSQALLYMSSVCVLSLLVRYKRLFTLELIN